MQSPYRRWLGMFSLVQIDSDATAQRASTVHLLTGRESQGQNGVLFQHITEFIIMVVSTLKEPRRKHTSLV